MKIDCFIFISALLLFSTSVCKLKKTKTESNIQSLGLSQLSAPEFDSNYLLGVWQCTGYSCGFRRNIDEEITISYQDNKFDAKKTNANGDRCVTQGHTTFHGDIPQNLSSGTNFGVTFWLGNLLRPSSGTRGYTCSVDDINNFHCQEIKCRRKSGYQPVPVPQPAPQPIVVPVPQPAPQPIVVPVPQPAPQPYIDPVPQLPQPTPQPYFVPQPQPYPVPQVQPLFYFNPPQYSYTFQPTYFFGTWTVDGYTCNNNVLYGLTVKVVAGENGQFQGTVANGNDCLPQGSVFLYGTLPQQITLQTTFNVNVVVAQPADNNTRVTPLYVLGLNYFLLPQLGYGFLRTQECPEAV